VQPLHWAQHPSRMRRGDGQRRRQAGPPHTHVLTTEHTAQVSDTGCTQQDGGCLVLFAGEMCNICSVLFHDNVSQHVSWNVGQDVSQHVSWNVGQNVSQTVHAGHRMCQGAAKVPHYGEGIPRAS
jgi:hypothetical protein